MDQPRHIQIKGRPVAEGSYPLIITPLVGHTPADIQDELQAILPQRPDLLEWRVDYFKGIADAAQVIATAHAIRKAAPGLPLLLTRRHVAEGGQPIALDEAAVVALYTRACEAGCVDLIDYELSNAPQDLARLRAVSAAQGVAMIMSYHNFECTPDADTLLGRFVQAANLGADVAKVAVMPQDPQDVLTLLSVTQRARQTLALPLISMSMSSLGALSRIAGWQYGSAATFAMGKHSSAPGQIAVDELRALIKGLKRASGDG